MLDLAAQFMATVDAMEANDVYAGREELAFAFLPLRYPGSVYSVPWAEDEEGGWEFSRFGKLPALDSGLLGGRVQMRDPVREIFC